MSKELTWDGDEGRALALHRPCPCGCDEHGAEKGSKGVGYLTGSDENGHGFTIWIENEVVYQRLAASLG